MAVSAAPAIAVRVSRRAAERLRAGHLWVYRSDVEAKPSAEPVQGSLISLEDSRGAALGTALWSTSSQIAARVVSREPALDRTAYIEQLRERLRQALRLRRDLAPVTAADNAHRLVFSEADGLPGIIADRYNTLVVLQLLIQGTAQPDVRAVVCEVFAEELTGGSPLTLWERPDPRIAGLEHLPEPPTGPLFASEAGGKAPTQNVFQLNSLNFGYDVEAGQKTGAFLDQRLNYKAAADWAERLLRAAGRPGRALDVCTYQGGFALHLARVCERVTGVDASRPALEAADRNLERNPHLRAALSGGVDWIEADAFDLLRSMEKTLSPSPGRPSSPHSPRMGTSTLPPELSGSFDAIVLDPPAFAKSHRAAEGALRGYKELNLRAMRLLAPGGLLVSCSCSHHVSPEDFRETVGAAALDARRTAQVLETRGAAPDHPELLALPETRYLKCLICRIE